MTKVSKMQANQAVLDALARLGSPSTAIDIARVTGLQLSTVYAACRRMARRRWMEETRRPGDSPTWTLTRRDPE